MGLTEMLDWALARGVRKWVDERLATTEGDDAQLDTLWRVLEQKRGCRRGA